MTEPDQELAMSDGVDINTKHRPMEVWDIILDEERKRR